MRIERIKIHNFRIYKDVDIDFSKDEEDIHLLIGKNGMGKTTFLNAINWCLYNKEPHKYSDSQEDTSLPILNLSHIDHKEDVDISVEIIVSSKDSILSYKRVEKYKAGNKTPYINSLVVGEKKPNGETIYYKKDDADYKVDNFVPSAIKEFFFFDGEQLDTYFIDQKADNIKNNIFILSHIDLLDRMADRLDKRESYFKKEAAKINPNIESIVNEISEKEQAYKTQEFELNELRKDTENAFSEMTRLNKELGDLPDLDVLNQERIKKEAELESILEDKDNKKLEIQQLTFKSSAPILLYDAILNTDNKLDDVKEELPPAIDEEELRKSLNNGKCTSCNQHLTENAIAFITDLLTKYKLSSEESKKLLMLKTPIGIFQNNVKNYSALMNAHKDVLKKLDSDSEAIQKRLDEIEKEFTGRDKDKVVNKFKALKEFTNIYKNNTSKIARSEFELEELDKEIQKLYGDLEKSKVASKIEKELLDKQKICHDSIKIIKKTMDSIMDVTREDIESFTRNTFFDLIWKQDTYSDIEIDNNYNLKLIHKLTNDNAIGSASAAERELVALAFTLGVHSISGFKSPLLIDTPLARVSDDHRINFANVLLEISKEKQIILIVTPDEFSDNIKPIFDESSQFEIEINKEEYMTNIRRIN